MTAAIGVLCARVRVEEKQILAALAEAGAPGLPLPPASRPLPVGPHPEAPPVASLASGDISARVVIDRCQDRGVAAAILPLWRAMGVSIVDAGIAATGDRLVVASALAAAGISQPRTRLVCSTEAAFAALDELGYPATLTPLRPGAPATTLLDRDTAEAVLEHRAVLGSAQDSLALVRAGAPGATERVTVIVVDERAVAIEDPGGLASYPARLIGLAEATAATLHAAVVGVEMALTDEGPVVWDVQPVPEFRGAVSLGHTTVGGALAELAAARFLVTIVTEHGANGRREVELAVSLGREVADDVALSA